MHTFKKLIFEITGICLCLCLLCGCGQRAALLSTDTTMEESGVQTETEITELPADCTTEVVSAENDMVAVYVCGAVNCSGVYYVPQGAIKETAVSMAGGFRDDADETYVNLAQTVSGGERIYIPTKEETAGLTFQDDASVETPSAQMPGEEKTDTGKVNINTATKEELMALPGIGESKADAIIAYREAQGKFQSTEELMNINGIKEGVYNKIKDLIIAG